MRGGNVWLAEKQTRCEMCLASRDDSAPRENSDCGLRGRRNLDHTISLRAFPLFFFFFNQWFSQWEYIRIPSQDDLTISGRLI